MFGMGPQEILVILVLALMLFSPRELPKVMKGLARFWGSIRRTAEDFRSAVLEDEELREPLEDIRHAYHGARRGLREAEENARRELSRARVEMRRAERALEQATRGVEQEAARTKDQSAATADGQEAPPASASPDEDGPGDKDAGGGAAKQGAA